MPLEEIDIINGTFSVIIVVISIFVGIKIVLNYFEYKDKIFFFVGFTWIFLFSGWYGSSVSFLIALIMGNEGLSYELYILINFIWSPALVLFWLYAFTEFLYKEKQKVILIVFSIITLAFETYLFYLLFTDPILIGEKVSPVDTQSNNIILTIYLISIMLIILITGILFGRETFKSDDPVIKLKGKMLLLAFPSFAIGAILDATIPFTAITLIIVRLILISSSIEFYGGFILPKWMKKFLIKADMKI